MTRLLLPAALLSLALPTVPAPRSDKPLRTEPQVAVLDLFLEVQALRTLYLFRVTPGQVKALQALAKDLTTPDREREKPRVSDDYRRVLVSLREALAADDEDQTEELEDRLTELTDSEAPELDDAVNVSAVARKRAPDVLKQLRPQQLASYFGSVAEQIGDPQERLVAGFREVRAEDEEWEGVRDELADDLAWLFGGLDATRFKAVHDEVVALLNRVKKLDEDAFARQRPALEKEARAIGADVASLDVLRHASERSAAKLLSNPRLVNALDSRQRAVKAGAGGGGR